MLTLREFFVSYFYNDPGHREEGYSIDLANEFAADLLQQMRKAGFDVPNITSQKSLRVSVEPQEVSSASAEWHSESAAQLE
jgi:hypothetical protein